MQAGTNRGYLHFASAKNQDTRMMMNQLRDDGSYLVLDMDRIVRNYEVWENRVGTITLVDSDRRPVRELSNWYIRYSLTKNGRQLETEWNSATHSPQPLGETPPNSLREFLRFQRPATSVYINQRQLQAITNTHAYESDVLRKAYRKQEHYSRQVLDIDTNFALAVQESWTMSPGHMDYEVHEQHWVPKHHAGMVSATQYMNEIAVGLERHIPPRQCTLEEELLNFTPANTG